MFCVVAEQLGSSRNPRYKGSNYKPWKDRSSAKKEEEATPHATSGGGGAPPKARCPLCNNDANRQGNRKCDPENKSCVHSAHPDLRGAQWDKKFYATETGKKYKALGQSWISAYKKLTPDGKSLDKTESCYRGK